MEWRGLLAGDTQAWEGAPDVKSCVWKGGVWKGGEGQELVGPKGTERSRILTNKEGWELP